MLLPRGPSHPHRANKSPRGTFMISRIRVGDPAASSLSSCLRTFPGGFSLIAESGQLRSYLVAHEEQQQDPAYAGSAKVVAAAPVRVCPHQPEGSFPLDKDIPVDHNWSNDGRILIVLRRASFTIYWKQVTNCASGASEVDRHTQGRAKSAASLGEPAPSLGLVELCTGSNGFEGSVVACCLLNVGADGFRVRSPPANSFKEKSNVSKYLIAVGGTFGIECHHLEVPPPGRLVDADAPDKTHENRKQEHRQQQQRQKPRRKQQKSVSRKVHVEKANGHGACHGEASSSGVQQRIAATGTGPATGCRKLTSLFHGYQVVSIAISPDSGLMAAAAMTGHVKVWNVNLVGPSPPSPSPPGRKKEPVAERGQRGWKNGSDGASEVMRPPRYGQGSDASELWGETLSMARPTSLSFSPDDCASFALACWDGSVAIFLSTKYNAGLGKDDYRAAAGGGRSWKRVWRETTALAKIGGGNNGNLEDQDGTFLCWCKDSKDVSPANLVVTTYQVKIGACARGRQSNWRGLPSAHDVETGTGDLSRSLDSVLTAAPGFEVFEGGLGERVGGSVLGPSPLGATVATVERYLIHGLAVYRGSVALYDSDLCLHVIPVSTLFGAGRIITQPESQNISALDACETSREAVSAAGEGTSTAPQTRKRTLVNNDHGLVAVEVRRGLALEGLGLDDNPPEGLRLSVVWRDANTGLETPDRGGLGGVAEGGEFARLPFLPCEIVDGEGQRDGVFGADVRWGYLALFTRYATLIYARPGVGVASVKVPEVGQWKSYPTYPLVHGVLFGGPSTAPSLRISDALADLSDMYLLVVLETDEGRSRGNPVVRVQSLRDRSLTYRCKLSLADGGHDASLETQGAKYRVHVPPGSGGGAFVVVTDGGPEACATVRHGTFDEATLRLKLAPPRVVTSSPWPPPKNLRLEGVAGPNCELFLFKDVGTLRSEEDANKLVRWWIAWPEMEIWKVVDAPALIGGEALGACDFVKIFQLELESMSQSAGRDSRPSSR